jgi:hypothetical protein
MTAKTHPAAMRFVPDQLPRERISDNHLTNLDPLLKEPARYVLFKMVYLDLIMYRDICRHMTLTGCLLC